MIFVSEPDQDPRLWWTNEDSSVLTASKKRKNMEWNWNVSFRRCTATNSRGPPGAVNEFRPNNTKTKMLRISNSMITSIFAISTVSPPLIVLTTSRCRYPHRSAKKKPHFTPRNRPHCKFHQTWVPLHLFLSYYFFLPVPIMLCCFFSPCFLSLSIYLRYSAKIQFCHVPFILKLLLHTSFYQG